MREGKAERRGDDYMRRAEVFLVFKDGKHEIIQFVAKG